ncbi:LTA synthase family protein [Alkalibacter mobilis]|uniref:LTA synthase family protein n=1 Tax=Alkalibacter mobilis TaxID=2787712 RepID=UPI00189FB813|nr:alkaline phosphatase family protein [Alkalibacter mobilis]MBF7096974.1 sulfatase-like hydrolase/transferase [Alkalibacter mobilis]
MIKIKSRFLGFYLVASLIFMELTFRLATSAALIGEGLVVSLVMVSLYGIGTYFVTTLFGKRTNALLSTLALMWFWIMFSSQIVYNKIFKTYYTVYSMSRGTKVFEFWRDIVVYTGKNIPWIVLMSLPLVLYIAFLRKKIDLKRPGLKNRILALLMIFVVYLGGVGVLNLGTKDFQSPYDLYYKSADINMSVEKLGLVTTMRLDLQRLVTGWSPEVGIPVVIGEETPENVDDDKPKIEYNVMDIDFDSLIANETNEEIKEMHTYFNSVPPTQKNEYTGIYEGYNVIVLTAEGFSPYAVREDVTPTLYKMVNEGYKFTNFYTPIWGVSTSDGEYVANVGLIPKGGVWSFTESAKIDLPLVLANQLNDLGYKSMGYHNHTYDYYNRHLSHPNMGYEYKGLGNGLNVKKVWPESDLEMMEVTVDEYMDQQPFHAYYMTVSGHLRYTFVGNSMAAKNRSLVEHLDLSDNAKAYIACQIELDRALEYLLSELRERGIADKTLIALSADHYPYGLEEETLTELAGHKVEKNFELYKNNFILYVDGMEPVVVDKPASSLDIIPTISNMLGLEYDSRLFMGRDIFAPGEPLVIFSNRSFITDKGSYNSQTKEFTPAAGVNVGDTYRKNIQSVINAKFHYSARILETDYFSRVIK